MSLTIVNDYFFKPDGNVDEGEAAAAELVEYFSAEVPEVESSLWLEANEDFSAGPKGADVRHEGHVMVAAVGQEAQRKFTPNTFKPHQSAHDWDSVTGHLGRLAAKCGRPWGRSSTRCATSATAGPPGSRTRPGHRAPG